MIGKQQEQQPQQETPRLSKEEYAAMRKAEREELQARVDAQAQEVFRDDASMKGFLNFMAQCTPQSTRNLLILYEQDPTITHPRTFDKWKEAGRSLRSGVTGYAFYADQEYEREDGTKGNGFTITKAFDISQTRGQQPLPSQQRLPEEIIAALVEQSPVPLGAKPCSTGHFRSTAPGGAGAVCPQAAHHLCEKRDGRNRYDLRHCP